MIEMSKIQSILTSAISSPSRTPLSSPFGLSPNPPSLTLSPGSLKPSPDPSADGQSQSLPPLVLSDPMLNVDEEWSFEHKIDPVLQFSDKFSFADVTPGDEYRHVKRASDSEQQRFIQQITKGKEFIEL
jgi:hypothetical protein